MSIRLGVLVELKVRRVVSQMSSQEQSNQAIKMRLATVSKNDGKLKVPVDPEEIANQLGIQVIKADLKPSIAGFILKKNNEPVKIYVNRSASEQRQRFTLAHELGHYWSHKDDRGDYGYVENRNELSSTGTDTKEIAANQFAAELLMPEKYIRSAWANGKSIQEIQSALNVSDAALGHRLVNLGLMSI